MISASVSLLFGFGLHYSHEDNQKSIDLTL
mgnify:FL=1